MHTREKMGGKKRLSCKTMAKLFNDELELSRSSIHSQLTQSA